MDAKNPNYLNPTIRALNAATGLHADARALEDLLGVEGFVEDFVNAADVDALLARIRSELRKLEAWAGRRPLPAKGAEKIADELDFLLGSSDESYVAVRKVDAKRWIKALRKEASS